MESYFSKKNANYSTDEIKKMVSSIKSNGFVEISDFFKKEVIESTTDYINGSRKSLKTDSFSLRYYDMEPCTFTELQQSTHLKEFLIRILEESGINSKESDVIHHVIRCTSGGKDANKYHFDAYDLTLLMPIITPDDDNLLCGDLIVFPNTRKFSTNLLKNILFKLTFQNKTANKIATKNWFKKAFNATTVKVKPGNAYLFYGFRSYHGNIAVDSSLVRATALFHYHDPFSGSKLIKAIENKRVPPQKR
jgi:hypothetical protein